MEESPSNLSIYNINLLEDGQLIEDGIITIDSGRISFAGKREEIALTKGVQALDGKGWFAAPGFIDLQLNGAFGVDFNTNPEDIDKVAARLPETGVTAFLATLITSPIDEYPQKLQAVLNSMASEREVIEPHKPPSRLLGAHLEGPFLNPEIPGVHQKRLFLPTTIENLEKLVPLEAVRLMTLAVEMLGGLEAVSWLRERGILASIGHSAATVEQGCMAFNEGVSYVTHLFNAMLPLHHRQPGLVGAVLGGVHTNCGLIVDGIHVHPLVVRLIYQCLGAKRLTLVSDAMTALGMPPGVYMLAGQEVMVNESGAYLPNGRLAGSVLSMDQAVRNMVTFSGCSLAEAVRMASTTPAEVLGIEGQFGHLKAGYAADVVFLNASMQVMATMIGGRLAYSRGGGNESV
jgi:N-acetylglucosamine-6-phosphate deacetylase